MKEGKEHASNAEKTDGRFGEQSPDEEHERGRDEGKEGNEPEMRQEVAGGSHERNLSVAGDWRLASCGRGWRESSRKMCARNDGAVFGHKEERIPCFTWADQLAIEKLTI
jgi:hypothetical protein